MTQSLRGPTTVYRLPVSMERRLLCGYYNRRIPRFSRPVAFSDKVNWRILNDRRPLLEWACDKLAMKKYAKHAGLERLHVPQTIWCGSDIGDLRAVDLISVGDQATLYAVPVIVALLVSPEAAGWFYVAWKIGGFYAVFASAVGTSAFAEGSHRPHRALPLALAGLRMALPFIVLGAAVTIFAGRLVLDVFGAQYAAHAYTLLVLLSLGALPDAVVTIYRGVLRVHKRYRTAAGICWAICISRLALTVLALAWWGIAGAIWCALDMAVHRGAVNATLSKGDS